MSYVGSTVPRIPGINHDLSKKKILSCPHKDKRYYAKGMCVNCYHRKGRTKKAWKCPHTHKMHYSKGLCKFCYLANYYKSRTDKVGDIPADLDEDEEDEEKDIDGENFMDTEPLADPQSEPRLPVSGD